MLLEGLMMKEMQVGEIVIGEDAQVILNTIPGKWHIEQNAKCFTMFHEDWENRAGFGITGELKNKLGGIHLTNKTSSYEEVKFIKFNSDIIRFIYWVTSNYKDVFAFQIFE